MASYEFRLPLEQWRQVLMNNSHADLCNVVLASRHMNSVASLPELWAGMKINKRKVLENGLAEFYNINRFRKVKHIDLERFEKFKHIKLEKCEKFQCEELERLLKEIPGSPLERVNLCGQDLSGVSAELLACAVSHLHNVNLSETHLTTNQCVALFKASLSSTTLMHVNLMDVNLSGVPTDLLASSISRLQDVNLWRTRLTTNQCVALFKASLSSTTLINLNLKRVNLSGVSAELLANSISRFQEVSLSGYNLSLTTDQCIALLNASLSSATLININLKYLDLSKVPADVLANLISRLQEVNLCRTNLTTEQCIALLKASLSSATLKKINLKYHDLSKVPADVLANSISRLQEVNLCRTDLRTEQCIVLLKASLSSATLQKINLENIFLDNVPADLLANSISRLQEVNLCGTFPTTEQCFELLKASLSSKTLIKIKLEGIFLDKVPTDLLAKSINRLQEVNLSRTNRTTEQCIALLKASLSSATLKKINLKNIFLDNVPADLLANSISRLQEVNLCQTYLKSEQCIALLKASLSSVTLTHVNLDYVDLSEVPAELLANSISRLQEVSLYGTDLTIDQSVALLKVNLSSTILTNINMKEVKLSEFPAEVLANSTKRIWE